MIIGANAELIQAKMRKRPDDPASGAWISDTTHTTIFSYDTSTNEFIINRGRVTETRCKGEHEPADGYIYGRIPVTQFGELVLRSEHGGRGQAVLRIHSNHLPR